MNAGSSKATTRLRINIACMAGVALLCAVLAAHAGEGSTPLLHAMFQDHAVLQRDQPIHIWGTSIPGSDVTVELAGKRARGHADAKGFWQAELPPLKAGGPYLLKATAGAESQVVDDVLVGDVWLCSGQSNMELPVRRALDADSEIAAARNTTIRLLKVPRSGAAAPQAGFASPVKWYATTPDTVRDFSAACYYFARELQKTVDVPMGLIDAAWGGSRIQAWTSSEALRTTGLYGDELDVLAMHAVDPVAAAGRWGEIWSRWWRTRQDAKPGEQPCSADASKGWRKAPSQLGAWERWGVPELSQYDGMMWFRTRVTLTADQAARDATLSLGAADEMDMTWVNGRGVGSAYDPGGRREYSLPRGVLHEGVNSIVINVLDTYRDGGLAGPASTHALRFADGSSVALDGVWEYRAEPGISSPPQAPWQTAAGLSTLYNGMIAPIGRFNLRGMLWYQGESNTFEAARYRELLRLFRGDVRSHFGPALPLLIVQLAGYGQAPTRPGESGWAGIREAQRQVAAEDPNTGLAIAIDIGDRYDVHPSNKQEVGRRLARVARHVVYGETLPPSGPVPVSGGRAGDAVVLTFGGNDGELVALGADGPIGFELCGAQPGSCRYADAQVSGNRVTLHAVSRETARIRYCWADGPLCTLFDGAGLPAGPFEMALPATVSEGRSQ